MRRLALVFILSLLVLMLTAGAAPHRPLASAPVVYAEVRFAGTPPERICPGYVYDIVVDVRTWSRPILSPVTPPAIPRFAVEAEVKAVSGPSLGTLLPLRTMSDEDGPAVFRYYPRGIGTERLEFDAVPAWSGFVNSLPPVILATPRPLQFEVTDCIVKVEMIYDGAWTIEGATFYFTGIMDDVTVEADENGLLHGEGTMVYNQTVTGLQGCTATWSTLEMPATISGEVGDDQLNLRFDFQGGQRVATGTCPLVGAVSTTFASDPSPLFNLPQSFPLDGGVVSYVSPGNPPPGRVWVIVTPEEDEEAVSDAGAPILAALAQSK